MAAPNSCSYKEKEKGTVNDVPEKKKYKRKALTYLRAVPNGCSGRFL